MRELSLLQDPQIANRKKEALGRLNHQRERRLVTIDAHRDAVRRVLAVMRGDLAEALDLAALASIAAMSPYHFLRVFVEVTGVSPIRFLASLRIERAKKLLIETVLPVTTICYEVGYNSLGTFTRLFVEHVGVTPQIFRRLPDVFDQESLAYLIAKRLEDRRSLRSDQTVQGRIKGSEHFSGLCFVGLFETSIPQRRPLDGMIVLHNGTFELGMPNRSQSYWVMAAAFPRGIDANQCLLPSVPELGVASLQIFCSQSGTVIPNDCDMILRRSCEFDPPILIALPVLLSDRKSLVLKERFDARHSTRH